MRNKTKHAKSIKSRLMHIRIYASEYTISFVILIVFLPLALVALCFSFLPRHFFRKGIAKIPFVKFR